MSPVSPPQRAESPPLLLNSPVFGAPAEASGSEEHQLRLLRKQLQQQEQQALAAAAQVPFDFTARRGNTGLTSAAEKPEKSAPIVSLHEVSAVAIVTRRAKLSQREL